MFSENNEKAKLIFEWHKIKIEIQLAEVKNNKFYYYKFSSGAFVSAMICQVRLISSKRLFRKMGRVGNKDFNEIKDRIKSFL